MTALLGGSVKKKRGKAKKTGKSAAPTIPRKWTTECQEAFDQVKEILFSELARYSTSTLMPAPLV